MARKKRPGLASLLVPAATVLIILAAIISFNSKKLSNLLVDSVENFTIDENTAQKFFSNNIPSDLHKEEGGIYDGPYVVKRVVDGDTFVVIMENTDMKVRLIGVDAPESVAAANYDKENSEEGKIASDYTKDILADKEIYLEYDVAKTDKYGRLLAYAYYEEDGQIIMINQKLISDGMAQITTIQPNVKYVELFTETQKVARESNIGFWKDNLFAKQEVE